MRVRVIISKRRRYRGQKRETLIPIMIVVEQHGVSPNQVHISLEGKTRHWPTLMGGQYTSIAQLFMCLTLHTVTTAVCSIYLRLCKG